MQPKSDYGSVPEPIGLDSAKPAQQPPVEAGFSSLIFSVFVPTILFGIGQGAVTPIIPLFAIELGATDPEAAFLVGLVGIGFSFLSLSLSLSLSLLSLYIYPLFSPFVSFFSPLFLLFLFSFLCLSFSPFPPFVPSFSLFSF